MDTPRKQNPKLLGARTAATCALAAATCLPAAAGLPTVAGGAVRDDIRCVVSEQAKLRAIDAAARDQFGSSVSVSGDTAVIGAWRDDDEAVNSGSAYIYELVAGLNWLLDAKLANPDPQADDRFGNSVSADGDVVVIGAFWDDEGAENAGKAHIYRRNQEGQWIREADLANPDPAPGDEFGYAVAVSGAVVLIGAPNADNAGTDSGSVYAYRYIAGQWLLEAGLTASDAAPHDHFGVSVSVSVNVAVIGASHDDDGGSNTGSAYVYQCASITAHWTEKAKLPNPDPGPDDWFGRCVSISGNVVMIGAPNDDEAGTDSGSARIYRRALDEWILEAELTAHDTMAYDHFGVSVSVGDDVAVVGACDHDHPAAGGGAGYAYYFDPVETDWHEKAKFTASDAADFDAFGSCVAVSGDRAIIGAPFEDPVAMDSGSAYLFHGLSDCNDNLGLDICDIHFGFSPDQNANGIPDECDCPWDLDGDGDVDVVDFLIFISHWGPCPEPCPPYCLGDVNHDCVVDVLDLLELLSHWGPCVPPAAACCLYDGSCLLLTEDDCDRLGVSWHPDVTCADIACPVPPDD